MAVLAAVQALVIPQVALSLLRGKLSPVQLHGFGEIAGGTLACWRQGLASSGLGSLPPPFPEAAIDVDGENYQGIEVSMEIPGHQLILDSVGESIVRSVKEGWGIPTALWRCRVLTCSSCSFRSESELAGFMVGQIVM